MIKITGIEGAYGPFKADEWAYVTDKVGFLAVKKLTAPEKESWARVARPLLKLQGKMDTELAELRAFICEQCKKRKDEFGVISCRVFGVPLDARALDKWLKAIPFTSAKVSDSRTDTVQKKNGECLVMEGDGWKLVVAGVMDMNPDRPSFPPEKTA